MPTTRDDVHPRAPRGTVATFLVLHALAAPTMAQQSAAIAETSGQRTARLAGQLQDRLTRQTRAGFTEEAAKTAKELDALGRAQTTKCLDFWTKGMKPDLGGWRTKTIMRKMQEYQRKYVAVADDCQWRPDGAPAGMDPDGVNADAIEEASNTGVRKVIAIEDSMARTPVFGQPALVTATGPEVPNPSMAFMAELTDRKDDELLKLLQEANTSDWTAARRVFERIASAAERGPTPRPGALLMALDSLRQMDERLGDHDAAVRSAGLALAFAEKFFGHTSPRLCHSLWGSASALAGSQQLDQAMAAASRCVAAITPSAQSSTTHASALNNLGVIHQRRGALPAALEAYRNSLAIQERVAEATPSQNSLTMLEGDPLVRIQANLGLALWQAGDAAEAARHFRAARMRMAKEGANFLTERALMAAMAKLAAEFDVMLAVERAAGAALGAQPSLALPMLLERKGLALEAKSQAIQWLAAEPRQLGEYRELLARRSALARSVTPAAREASHTTVREIDGRIVELEAAARNRRTTAAASAAAMDPQRQAYDSAVIEATMKILSERQKKAGRNGNAPDITGMLTVGPEAEAAVAPRFKAYLSAQQAQARGIRESLLALIQTRLSPTSALLEIVRYRRFNERGDSPDRRWGAAHYGVYVVRSTGQPDFVDLGEADPLDALIVEFRRSLAQPRGTLAHDLGRRLDSALLEPVRPRLAGVKALHVSPDGSLNLLPFGALVDPDDHYLVETFTFNYVSSGRDLVRDAPVPLGRVGPPVVIADPAFDVGGTSTTPDPAASTRRGSVSDRFGPLPATAVEAQALKALLPDASVYTGSRATETLMKAVSVPRILHVATHGFFLEDQDPAAASETGTTDDAMLRSGLVFAAVNARTSGMDDGILTALEAASLDLAGTQLVVLSACETGVGDVKTGEGVFGLRRAFTAAGVETLVMSLWQVEDRATQQLMVEFYRRLAQGEGRAEALRQASLALLRDPARRHPFYWASFISTGEAGRLRP